jgi:hypothetical protein
MLYADCGYAGAPPQPVSMAVLSQTMTIFRSILLLSVLLIVSCSAQFDNLNNFDFSNSEFVKLNDTNLNENQIKKLKITLNKLKEGKKEIYSKPSQQIIFKINSQILYISIFEEEAFVYKGHFLDAWTDRMEGHQSNGYELNNELRNLLNEFKT